MHKIFGIVFMCIFALTHHLPTISASASDLSLSSTSTMSSSSSSSSPSSSPSSAHTKAETNDIATAMSGDADISVKATDLFAIENDVAAKDISIAAAASSSSSSASTSSTAAVTETEQQNLPETRRQTRSLFYTYPYGGLYNNLYTGYNGGSYYYPTYPSYSYYPTVYKYWGGYNPYYGYPSVLYG